MAAVSLTALLNVLREQQFLRPDHLNELDGLQAGCTDAASLARNLVQRKWLTEYQAGYLLQGEADKLILGPYRLLDLLGEGGTSKHSITGREAPEATPGDKGQPTGQQPFFFVAPRSAA
jgi:hypothetical protein